MMEMPQYLGVGAGVGACNACGACGACAACAACTLFPPLAIAATAASDLLLLAIHLVPGQE